MPAWLFSSETDVFIAGCLSKDYCPSRNYYKKNKEKTIAHCDVNHSLSRRAKNFSAFWYDKNLAVTRCLLSGDESLPVE